MENLQDKKVEPHIARLDLIALDDDTGTDIPSLVDRQREVGQYNELFGQPLDELLPTKGNRVVRVFQRLFRSQ